MLKLSREEKYEERLKANLIDSLACCDTEPCKPAAPIPHTNIIWKKPCTKEEKEQNMRYDTNMNLTVAAPSVIDPDQNAREYLDMRLDGLRESKDYDLRGAFNLRNDAYPKDAHDMVARILAGKYEIIEPKNEYNSPELIWRDPAKKRDDEGYTAAEKLMQAAYQKAKDDVMVTFPEAALESVRTFEAATFH